MEGLEKFESVKGGLKGVVIGKVVSKEKHPDADKLTLTKVDIGKEELLSIVCGALMWMLADSSGCYYRH